MKKEYAHAIRTEFDAQLPSRLPGFALIRGHKGLGTGVRLYRREAGSSVFHFVLLLISSSHDEFTVEVGGASSPEIPVLEPFFEPSISGNKYNVRFRLSSYWDRQDPWWAIFPTNSTKEFIALLRNEPPVEQGLARIPNLVQDSLDKLEQYAVPYWDEQR